MLAVLTSGRGRLNGAAFAIGFVVGQALFMLLAFTAGAFSSPDRHRRFPTFAALVTIAFGAALVGAAVYLRRRRARPPRATPSAAKRHTDALRARLSSLRPATALGTGFALGLGGPKRIAITILAAATITAAGVSDAASLSLAVVYVVVATVLVWVPVVLYVVFGPRAARWLTDGEQKVAAHKGALTFYPSAVLGVVLVVDGIVQLAT